MKLIVGLGNPGKEYEATRHNVGFMVIDEYIKKNDIKKSKKKFGGIYYEINHNGEKVIFLKPQKYINLSGEVIIKFIKYFNIDISDILIISDDLDLNVGSYRLRASGSSGGHNGLKNIEEQLNTNEYKRLRIGISNNKEIDTRDYVLGKISKESMTTIQGVIKESMNIIDDYISTSFIDLMNKYNKKQ